MLLLLLLLLVSSLDWMVVIAVVKTAKAIGIKNHVTLAAAS